MPKLRLGINIDHVATLRNARKRHPLARPDLVRAADAVLEGGADGITFHLREDRRHVTDADVARLMKHLRARKIPVNLEIAATDEMVYVAQHNKPHAVCLVPEKRREVTTEGGLDVIAGGKKLSNIVNKLESSGLRVSLFINPNAAQTMAAYATGATAIELHTGAYCEASGSARKKELKRLQQCAAYAAALGLEVHAGHGLDYDNVAAVAAIPEITELNIGHALVGEALFTGLPAAVRRMRRLMLTARRTGAKAKRT